MSKLKVPKRKHWPALVIATLMALSLVLSLINLSRSTTYFDCNFENATHSFIANGWTGNASDTSSNSYITTVNPYSGSYAGRFVKGVDSRSTWAYKSGLSNTLMYARGMFNFSQLPIHTDSGFFHFLDFYAGTSNPQSSWRAIATIKYVDASHRYWALRYAYGGSFTEGENVTAIQPSTNTYYTVELKINSVASGEIRMYVDGTEVASVTGVNLSTGGTASAIAIGEIYGDFALGYIITVDDFKVTDTYNGPASGLSVSNVASSTTVAGASCIFSSKWTSTVGNMSKYIFGTNNTGTWTNDTVTAFGAPAGAVKWANVTKTLNSTVSVLVQWRVWANNTDNVWSATSLQSIMTTNQMTVTNVGKTSSIAGSSSKFYAYWTTSAGTLSKYIFGTNNTGSWVNDTATTLGGTGTWSNVTKTLNSVANKLIQWRFWANNTNGIWLTFSVQSFSTSSPASSKYTVWANSGTRPDIQTAVNDVRNNGPNGEGMVRIPSGQWTLDDNGIGGYTSFYTLEATAYLVFSYGGIDIIGAGMYQTNLTLRPNDATYSSILMIVVDGSNQLPFRISGISFFGRTGASASATGDVGILTDSSKDFRIDHNSFKWMGSCGVENFNSIPSKTSRGVIDHNQFIDIYKRGAEAAGTGYGYGVGVDRTYQKGGGMQTIVWNQYGTPDQFYGSYNNVTYIEDNYFSGVRHAITAFALGSYVSRYNTFTDMHVDYGSGFNDIHGQYDSTNPLVGTFGGRYMEVYSNKFYNPANDTNYPDNYPTKTMYDYARAARLRGGASLIWNNTADNYMYFINFAWDTYNTETTRPKNIYIWNNTYDGGLFDIDEGTHIEGTTYFLYAKPGYTPYQYPHPLVTSTPTLLDVGHPISTKNTASTFYSHWLSSSGLSGYVFGTNNTGAWVNDTWVTLSGGMDVWANKTKTLINQVSIRIEYQFWVNDTQGQWVNTGIKFLVTTATGAPYYSVIGLNTTVRGWVVKFYIKWHDSSGLSKSVFSWNGTGSWANDTAYTLTGTESWHNLTKTLPMTIGTHIGYRWYANNTGGTWSPQTGLQALTTKQLYYFYSFLFRDYDNYPVNSIIAWTLYNASTPLTYTEGSSSILNGTYTLKTSYRGNLLNTTSLATVTHGNKTVTIKVSMKITVIGYIGCNVTLTAISFQSATATNITVTLTGSAGPVKIVIDVPKNATYIKKNGVRQTGWTYSSYVITITSNSLSKWEFYFGTETQEPPTTIITSGNNITLYFRTDSRTTNTITAYALDEVNSNNMTTLTDSGSGNVSYGFRIWRIRNSGALVEITSGTTSLFTLTSSYLGTKTATWNMPLTSLSLGFDALELTIYQRFGVGAWSAKASYITNTIISKQILLQTWSFNINLNVSITGTSVAHFKFGSSSYESYVTGVGFKEPSTPEVQAYYLNTGDILNWIFYGYYALFGQSLFYGLMLLLGCSTMYVRYRNIGPVVLMLILFGGVGGLVWALVPAPAMFVVWVILLVGLAVVIFRVIR